MTKALLLAGRSAVSAGLGDADGSALGPYRAFFYSNEGSDPAHVHVRRDDFEAKFWLHDLSVAVNAGFPPREIADIIRHHQSRRLAGCVA